jgi:hypothetical protein
MKIPYLLFLIFPLISYGQNNYYGDIIDKNTKEKIPFATIGLIKENTGINADENGRFALVSRYESDTLIISSIGYESLKFSVNMLPLNMLFELQKKSITLKDILIVQYKKSETINEFSNCGISYYKTSGMVSQVAQQFQSPAANSLLSEINICKSDDHSLFRIRVYSMDSLSGLPSIDLADTIIEIKTARKHVHIDVAKYNIYIPGRDFFVAIEWLKIPYNENKEKIKKGSLTNVSSTYSPSIAYKPESRVLSDIGKPIKVWQKLYTGNWIKLSGRLLISATVKY